MKFDYEWKSSSIESIEASENNKCVCTQGSYIQMKNCNPHAIRVSGGPYGTHRGALCRTPGRAGGVGGSKIDKVPQKPKLALLKPGSWACFGDAWPDLGAWWGGLGMAWRPAGGMLGAWKLHPLWPKKVIHYMFVCTLGAPQFCSDPGKPQP